MADYEMLASGCDPDPACPKVTRGTPGTVAIVGELITDPTALAALGVGPGEAAVQITEALYRAGHDGLGG
ncbi:MAG: hypothetical protein ACRDT0_08490 [Pseudonocardiaceae bacterium]